MSQPNPSLPARCFAELLGTFLLIFFGCGSVHAAVLTGAQSGVWQVAIVWGVAVTIAIYVVGGISGAHINPAMTFSFCMWGGFPWRWALPYIISQTVGAFLAAAALFVLYGPYLEAKEQALGLVRGQPGSEMTAMCYGEFYPNPGAMANDWKEKSHSEVLSNHYAQVTEPTAFFGEFLGTLILALAVFALIDERNPGGQGKLAPVFIGLSVAILISVYAPLTQACFNPARDFGPRLFSYFAGWGEAALPGPNGRGFWTVYIVAPIAGALVGGGLYQRILRSQIAPGESNS